MTDQVCDMDATEHARRETASYGAQVFVNTWPDVGAAMREQAFTLRVKLNSGQYVSNGVS